MFLWKMGESEGREKVRTVEAQRARRGDKSKSMHHRDTEDTEKGNRVLQENPLRTQRLCGEILSWAEEESAPSRSKGHREESFVLRSNEHPFLCRLFQRERKKISSPVISVPLW